MYTHASTLRTETYNTRARTLEPRRTRRRCVFAAHENILWEAFAVPIRSGSQTPHSPFVTVLSRATHVDKQNLHDTASVTSFAPDDHIKKLPNTTHNDNDDEMIQDDELVRRINLLEILAEDHEDVTPPPEDAARDW